ncbi:MAG: hypothetical protein MUC28_01855 [Planctomycetes bacterium]|jgi:hypothetical protein|nr:hypothetical protein [Planctomycetota bacterium]
MGIENSFGKFKPPVAEKTPRPGEKLEGEKREIWEKAKSVLAKMGFDFSARSGEEKEKELIKSIKRIKQMEKGGEYDNEEENLFLETDLEYMGKGAHLKMVAQADKNYDPGYKIDYAKESPDFQKEAERRLKREAITGQKLPIFTKGRKVSADIIEEAETIAGRDMFLLKTTEQSAKNPDDFGYDEGRETAKTLLILQYEVNSSALVNEVMREQGYKTQYELENEFSEDIFNDFNGYMDNSRRILKDRIKDRAITKKDAQLIEKEMEKYRSVIESRQMGEGEYSLAHNGSYLENMVVGRNGEVYLRDWNKVGTTQNRELSLINDLGLAFESAREHLGEEKAGEFIRGAEEEIKNFYTSRGENEEEKAKNRLVAEAVIRLTKLRTFAEK